MGQYSTVHCLHDRVNSGRLFHMPEFTVHTPADLTLVADALLGMTPTILACVGPLGAGKTTLTQAIGKALGVREQVTSPTYVLQQVYRIARNPAYDTLVHVDCYRIKTDHELPALDLAYWAERPKTLVIIEWADRIRNYLKPLHPTWVTFVVRGETREITVR